MGALRSIGGGSSRPVFEAGSDAERLMREVRDFIECFSLEAPSGKAIMLLDLDGVARLGFGAAIVGVRTAKHGLLYAVRGAMIARNAYARMRRRYQR